jgi:hypothetical protein
MKKFTTIEGRACLKKVNELLPRLRNYTRWNSSHRMLRHHVRLLPSIQRFIHATCRDGESAGPLVVHGRTLTVIGAHKHNGDPGGRGKLQKVSVRSTIF